MVKSARGDARRLGRHQPERIFAVQHQRDALEPGLFARLIVDQLALEPAALRPFQVHPEEHLGPVLRLHAAGAGMDGHDRIRCIVLAGQHLLGLGGVHLRLECVEGLLQVGADIFAALRPFEQDADVVDLLGKAVAQLEVFGEPALSLQRLLCLGLVVPERGSGDLLFELR
jgi:hypothetical protein